MYVSVPDFNIFYNSNIGRIAQDILQSHIMDIWPDTHGLRVLGCGYAMPYLDPFCRRAERVIALMPDRSGFDQEHEHEHEQSVQHWPEGKKNLVMSSAEDQMPIENCSVDRVLLVHHLEYCDNLQPSLREIWRILKANGRLLVIVPNRTGVWSRADWSPFGHGRVFSNAQLSTYLQDSLLSPESHRGALFVPPMPDSPILMRSANLIEKMGGSILPFVAGVHIIEASKQIYASADIGGNGLGVLAKTRELLAGKGKTVPQSFTPPKENLK